MLDTLIFLLGILLTILLIVGIHEFGHFLAARCVGVKVLRFSIGFGKKLFAWRDKKGTEYVLAAIPLGGYVKMLNEDEVIKKEELHLAYHHQPFYKKLIIVIAGPLFNLLFALMIYWFLFIYGFTTVAPIIANTIPNSIAAVAGIKTPTEIIRIDEKPVTGWMSVIIRILPHVGGSDTLLPIITKNLTTNQTQTYQLKLINWKMQELKPDPLESLGIIPYEPTIPAIIEKFAPSYHQSQSHLKSPSHLQVGDKIIAINGKVIDNQWKNVFNIITTHPKQTLLFTIERANKLHTFPVYIQEKRGLFFKKYGYLGMTPAYHWPKEFLRHIQYNPHLALTHAWQNVIDFSLLNFLTLEKLFTGKLSLQSLGGPISIFSTAGNSFNAGFVPFLSFLAFLSISIGIINLLPIPGLDGAHILFQTIEWITRRPISLRVQTLCYRLGFIFLILILIQTITNDIARLV